MRRLLVCAPLLVGACSSFSSNDEAVEAGAPIDATVADADADVADAAPDATFIDDFERPELRGPWTNVPTFAGGNVIALDTAKAAHGAQSLHVTSATTKGSAFLERLGNYGAIDRIELAVQVESLPDVGFVLGKLTYENDTEVNLSVAANGFKLAEQKRSSSGSYKESSPTALAAGKWTSLVWTIDYAARSMHVSSPDEAAFSIDYVLSTTQLGANVTAVRAGIVFVDNQSKTSSLWIDDFSVQ